MAAHGICFECYYRPKPSQIGQNGSAAAADARLAVHIVLIFTSVISSLILVHLHFFQDNYLLDPEKNKKIHNKKCMNNHL